ncbi:MAG: hypothetical protein ACJ72V_20095, partial [Nitrososphaeraceae archaeon]
MTIMWQLHETRHYCIRNRGLIAVALLAIIIILPILQPALASSAHLPAANRTIYDSNNNEYKRSVTLTPTSNQSNASS